MEKNFPILENSMILEYHQEIEAERRLGRSSARDDLIEGRPEDDEDEFRSRLPHEAQVPSSHENKSNFLMESLHDGQYDEVENCVISEASEMSSVSINPSVEESIVGGTNIGLSLSSNLELPKGNVDCLAAMTSDYGRKSNRNNSNLKDDRSYSVDVLEKGNNNSTLNSSTLNNATDEAATVNSSSPVMASSSSIESNVDTAPSLQFLGTGSSIVVLAQDPNNIELGNLVSEMPIPCGDKEMGIERYQYQHVADHQNAIATDNVNEDQPTFFQVELYSTSSLQSTVTQGPATVISAQQVLTVPQLFSCQWEGCNTHFLSKDDLILHVTSQHAKPTQPQKYKCMWSGCIRDGKSFDARYKILTHLRIHTGERPHVCSVDGCERSFARLDNLKIHMRSHTGERPYVCPYDGCTKSYANSSDRFKHTRTHVEKKPYRCKYEGCDKSYTDPSSLRKHHRRHRNDENKLLLNDSTEPVVILPAMGNE